MPICNTVFRSCDFVGLLTHTRTRLRCVITKMLTKLPLAYLAPCACIPELLLQDTCLLRGPRIQTPVRGTRNMLAFDGLARPQDYRVQLTMPEKRSRQRVHMTRSRLFASDANCRNRARPGKEQILLNVEAPSPAVKWS